MNLGKRALKKARTRLDLLDAVYRLSNEVRFRDLRAKAIAAEIGITEMTFFNYFQKKEDILRYMMGIWALDLQVLQLKSPLSGEPAIRRIFRHTAVQVKKHPGLMTSLIAYLVTNEIETVASEIEPADRFLLYPEFAEVYDKKIPGGNEMIVQHLVEMDPSRDPTPTLLHLASCFYGDVLVAHTAGRDLDALYTASLDLILGTAQR